MRKLLYAAGAVAVLAAAVYVYVYLSRWEWQRALFTAALLLIAEVAVVGGLVLERIGRLESRLRDAIPAADEPATPGDGAARTGSALDHLRATAPPPRITFRWLRPDGPAVFVPVLLGAGIMVSGLAWVVERVARATARQAMERDLATQLAPLTLPAGGPLDGTADVADPTPRRPWFRSGTVLVAVVTLAVMGGAVYALAAQTQDRPDEPTTALVSTLVVEADRAAGSPGDLEAKVTERWELCRETSRLDLTGSGLLTLSDNRFAIVTQPALGEHAARRLRGCLQDATVDHARLTVLTVSQAPAPPATTAERPRVP